MTDAYLRAYEKLFGTDSADHIPDMEPDQHRLLCEMIAVKLTIGNLQARLVQLERMIAEHENEHKRQAEQAKAMTT